MFMSATWQFVFVEAGYQFERAARQLALAGRFVLCGGDFGGGCLLTFGPPAGGGLA
jgi:hypothetical protein